MKKLIFVLLIALSLGCQHAQVSNIIDSNSFEFGTFVEKAAETNVVLIPQWHLSPQTNTKASSQNLPQSENQISIYKQLSQWIQSKSIKSIIVEGCEGEINSDFKDSFNGWMMADLKNLEPTQLDAVMTHVGMKIETRFPSAKVLCGDNLELIRKHQLALSDLRGLFGFKLRIAQFKDNPKKRKSYLQSAQELLKISDNSSEEKTMQALNSQLQQRLNDYENLVLERNRFFVKAIKNQIMPSAVVIGAVHITDLSQTLKKEGLNVAVFKPHGLENVETELNSLIEQVRSSIISN